MKTDKASYPCWRTATTVNFSSKAEATNVEYKFIMAGNGKLDWEGGDNRVIDLSGHFDAACESGELVVVQDEKFGKANLKGRVVSGGDPD